MVNKWIGWGFAAYGLLVGTLAGLSSAELTVTLLGLIFTLIGGSIVAFIGKIDTETRKLSGIAILMFSIMAFVGLYSGIFIKTNRLLDIPGKASETISENDGNQTSGQSEQAPPKMPYEAYLRSQQITDADLINDKLRNKYISIDEAYRQMYGLIRQGEEK